MTTKPWGRMVSIPYAGRFSRAEYDRMVVGIEPKGPRDQWRIVHHDDSLSFFDAETGEGVYRIDFVPDLFSGGMIARRAKMVRARLQTADGAYDARLLEFLVSNGLLGRAVAYPLPESRHGLSDVLQHHVQRVAGEVVLQRRRLDWWQQLGEKKTKVLPEHDRQVFALPDNVVLALERARDERAEGALTAETAAAARAAVGALDVAVIAPADSAIRWRIRSTGKHGRGSEARLPRLMAYLRLHKTQAGTAAFEDEAWLDLYAADGRARQRALQALTSPPASAYEFAAIVYRMNDWARPVAEAAQDFAERFFAETDPRAIAEAGLYLLTQRHQFGRWQERAQAVVNAVFQRQDVLEQLALALRCLPEGGWTGVMKQCMREPGFDRYLLDLARQAKLAPVRMIAMRALLSGAATHYGGWDKEWIDKVSGRFRWVPMIESRPLTVTADGMKLIQLASLDRCADVRKVATDALFHPPFAGRQAEMLPLIERLAADPNRRVREGAEYILAWRARTGLAGG